jgi:hypothetical protein
VNPKNKGMFGFSLAVDFSKSMQDKNYFLDQNNFHLNNNNYKLKSKLIDNPNDISKKGFTHIITLETNKIQDETLKIDVIGTTPSWVYKSSSIDDTNIESNPEEKKKTYGLKSLIEGVNDAFYPPTKTNTINSIKVTIKQ